MYCGNCGKELNEGMDFCPECGQKVKKDNNGVKQFETIVTNVKDKAENVFKGNPKKIIVLAICGVLAIIVIVLVSHIHECYYCGDTKYCKKYHNHWYCSEDYDDIREIGSWFDY